MNVYCRGSAGSNRVHSGGGLRSRTLSREERKARLQGSSRSRAEELPKLERHVTGRLANLAVEKCRSHRASITLSSFSIHLVFLTINPSSPLAALGGATLIIPLCLTLVDRDVLRISSADPPVGHKTARPSAPCVGFGSHLLRDAVEHIGDSLTATREKRQSTQLRRAKCC